MRLSHLSLSLSLLFSVSAFTAHAAQPAERPNILVLLSDDQGFADIGYRSEEVPAPHLDALAASGVRLEQFYVQPVCTPAQPSPQCRDLENPRQARPACDGRSPARESGDHR